MTPARGRTDRGEDASGIRFLGRARAPIPIPTPTPTAPSWPELVSIVRAQVRSLVGPTRDLDDLTQTTLEHVVRAMPRFEGRCETTTFTYRIASRVVMNHWRSFRRYLRWFVPGSGDGDGDELGGPAAPNDDPFAIVERERAVRLHHHLERLPADHRFVVVLADLEELPAARIAEILDVPEPTVRSRLARARGDLQKRLARDPVFADAGARGRGGRP